MPTNSLIHSKKVYLRFQPRRSVVVGPYSRGRDSLDKHSRKHHPMPLLIKVILLKIKMVVRKMLCNSNSFKVIAW
uniref:Ovule protein n=1 Tax=Heterorhabditis bacteriophora TaxID=37862 RepID=A0A1I7WGM0_HETBA